jgi:hypothetical protein
MAGLPDLRRSHTWSWARVVDLDERDTRSSLQLSTSDRTRLLCDGASDEAARKVDQQRSQSLGISKHTELAASSTFERATQNKLVPESTFPLNKGPLGGNEYILLLGSGC